MKTFVINLKRRRDRRNYMRTILPPNLAPEFTTNWKSTVDGKEITNEILDGFGIFQWKINSNNKWWNRPLWKGEVACAINHWHCWRRAFETNDEIFLILEDDVFFVFGIWEKLYEGIRRISLYDPNWELLYIGRENIGKDHPTIKNIVKPGYSYDSHAYLLTRSAVEKLLNTSYNEGIIPVDEFLPAMYIDHPREDIRERYPKCLSAYAFDPPLAFQIPKSLGVSDVKDNVEYFES